MTEIIDLLPEPEVGREWIRVATVPQEPGGSFGIVLATEAEAEAGVDEAPLDGPESSSSAVAVVAVAVSGEVALGLALHTDNPVAVGD